MEYTKSVCIGLLKSKQAEIVDRYVRRSDFSDEEVAAIKSYLGPWPRALEAAGIKPTRDFDRIEKNREKRARAKARRRAAKNGGETE